MGPQVTVVVPTHNRSRLLGLTLRSILWQREVDLEVVVVDDGSRDDTAAVVAGFGDGRLRLVRHDRPLGVSAARNRGIAEARGGWVGFCDDDDLWSPDKLLRQLHGADAAGAEWVYGGAVFIDGLQRVHGGAPPPPPEALMGFLVRWSPVPGGCSNVIVAHQALRETGPFACELGTLADWDLWLRLAARGAPAWVPRPLVAYRVHASNMSLDVARTLVELDLLEARHGLAVDRSRFDRYLASLCLRSGRKGEALRLLLRAALVDRPGYGAAQARADVAMMLRFARAGARRRLRLAPSPRQRRRHERERRQDPNLAWKAEAQAWLDSLRDPPDRSTRLSTQA
jgi:glycosyltransferase involved in cell wall biosynthesis